ncbi:isochorismatase family protein [Ornithinimicrobium humiphilum]|uniref:Nicotinamidase-related amidase n=1 Tax=Ornithinimicrobium humiphilum TaxID=125288 RepID=A0A543K7J4_9MICO|nr:isochorismatase family cysteine hydrolase [Ornithinimicrobium humiphilum]TQM91061.1 nicotinamidase-related amidase [Ornithinimicrobium humiphilum]
MTSPDPWLVVIDAQAIFADPASEWVAPRFAETVDPVRELVAEHGERAVATRWVPPRVKQGSWVPYFETFPFADRDPDDPIFDLVPEVASLGIPHVVSEPTFGKWGPGLAAVTGEHAHLVLAGVATDCCVLSTALAAADAGCFVEVVPQACAGSTDEAHERALAAMRLYAPQIVVRS